MHLYKFKEDICFQQTFMTWITVQKQRRLRFSVAKFDRTYTGSGLGPPPWYGPSLSRRCTEHLGPAWGTPSPHRWAQRCMSSARARARASEVCGQSPRRCQGRARTVLNFITPIAWSSFMVRGRSLGLKMKAHSGLIHALSHSSPKLALIWSPNFDP